MIGDDAFATFLDEPRWLAWREEVRRGRPTKVPYAAASGTAGSSTDPATWGTHAAASRRAQLLNDGRRKTGCGIVLGDIGDQLYLAGLDLDSSLAEDHTLAGWAEEIIATVGSYAEISPSEHGLKIFFYVGAEAARPFLDRIGVEPDKWGTKRGIPGVSGADHGPGIELYLSGRYFTVTGRGWSADHPQIIELDADRLAALAALIPKATRPRERDGGGRDSSRSAKALGAARKLKAASYAAMCAGLRQHIDPEIRQWLREKGEADGERELRRIWAIVDPDADTDWGDPDLELLRLHRRAPPELPLDCFGPWAAWLVEAARAAACPIDYVMAPLLAAVSALIGHARWARAVPGWSEPPHLWICAVGDSGNG